jgi:hypothetical protein
MNHTRDLLFALTRQRFTSSCQERVAELCHCHRVDWASVAAIAAAEGVAPIVGVNLAACDPAATNVPAALTERLQHALFENVALKFKRRRQLIEGLVHFDVRGYDVLLLKSAALEASGVYERPWVTCARDMDLVLRRRDAAPLAPDEWAVRTVSQDNGIECEINGHHDVSIFGLVDLSFDGLWRASRPVPFEEAPTSPAYVMCPEDLLFTLCLNACRKRYFRLKTLFDIAETVAHYPDLDWKSFDGRVRAAEAHGVVFTALCAADETLGLPAPGRECYVQLVGRGRAHLLRSLIKALRRSRSLPPAGFLTLRYASFNNRQRFRSAQRSAMHWPGRQLTARELAESALPGQ